jgi:hypothetical protein
VLVTRATIRKTIRAKKMLYVRNLERVYWRDKEKIEREDTQEGREECRAPSPADSAYEDREEINKGNIREVEVRYQNLPQKSYGKDGENGP